jgi:hypothetical protein
VPISRCDVRVNDLAQAETIFIVALGCQIPRRQITDLCNENRQNVAASGPKDVSSVQYVDEPRHLVVVGSFSPFFRLMSTTVHCPLLSTSSPVPASRSLLIRFVHGSNSRTSVPTDNAPVYGRSSISKWPYPHVQVARWRLIKITVRHWLQIPPMSCIKNLLLTWCHFATTSLPCLDH